MTIRKTKGASVTDGAQHVADGRWDIPRYTVVPTIASVPAGTLLVDTNDGTLQLVLATVNPGDAVVAASRLIAGTTDVRALLPEDEISFAVATDGSDGEITSIYLLAVADGGTDTTANNGIVDSSTVKNRNGGATVGTVAMNDATEAEILAATNMVVLDFSSADKVRDVVLRMGPLFNTQAYITVEGRSYA